MRKTLFALVLAFAFIIAPSEDEPVRNFLVAALRPSNFFDATALEPVIIAFDELLERATTKGAIELIRFSAGPPFIVQSLSEVGQADAWHLERPSAMEGPAGTGR